MFVCSFVKSKYTMKKTTKKIVLSVVLFGILIAMGTVYYLFNMPHRDVQATKTDYTFKSGQIVNEYLADALWRTKNIYRKKEILKFWP